MGTCEYDQSDRRYGRYNKYYDDDDDDEAGYHHIEDILETNYAVKTLVDLEGHVVTQGLDLNQDDILQDDCFDVLDQAAEEEYEGYMGNSGPTATHWYRVAAIAIVPRDSLVSFFASNSLDDYRCSSPDQNLNTQIKYLARACL